MKKHVVRLFAVMAAVMFLSLTVLELNAHARVGGSRSSGSRGSRSYSRPASPYSQPSQSRQQIAPAPGPFQQPQGGGFMRSMAGGMTGGLLGGMLFSSLGFAGTGGMGGGGIGLFEILLLAGLGYLIYRFIKKESRELAPSIANQDQYQAGKITPGLRDALLHKAEIALERCKQIQVLLSQTRKKDVLQHLFPCFPAHLLSQLLILQKLDDAYCGLLRRRDQKTVYAVVYLMDDPPDLAADMAKKSVSRK